MLNLQVLNELASVLERKRWFDTHEDVFRIVDHFVALGSSPVTLKTVETARTIKRANVFPVGLPAFGLRGGTRV